MMAQSGTVHCAALEELYAPYGEFSEFSRYRTQSCQVPRRWVFLTQMENAQSLATFVSKPERSFLSRKQSLTPSIELAWNLYCLVM